MQRVEKRTYLVHIPCIRVRAPCLRLQDEVPPVMQHAVHLAEQLSDAMVSVIKVNPLGYAKANHRSVLLVRSGALYVTRSQCGMYPEAAAK